MDQFNYLAVLISIVLGLSITQLLGGIGRLVQARARVRTYGPTLGWTGALLIIDIQTWWTTFGLRGVRGWTFIEFLVVLLQPILLYLMSALVLPDFTGNEPVDLRAHYFANDRWLFGVGMLLILASILKDLVIGGALPSPPNLAAHALFFAMFTAAALTRREWFHRLLTPVMLVALAAYIALLFARLR